MAGGAGRNQVRIFDYESGNLVCVVSDMPRSVLCMDVAHTSNGFAFGSADSCVRIMDIQGSIASKSLSLVCVTFAILNFNYI